MQHCPQSHTTSQHEERLVLFHWTRDGAGGISCCITSGGLRSAGSQAPALSTCHPLPTSTELLVPSAPLSLGCPELTHAVLARGIRLVAQVADTAVAPAQVLAHAVGADVWVQGTFIDVCTEQEVK